MKTVISLGFKLWTSNHCGCRRIVHARKSFVRDCEFQLALGIRRVLLSMPV